MHSIPAALLLTLLLVGAAAAQAEPPIQGPADAACREEAQAKVFTAPNPNHLSLWDLDAVGGPGRGRPRAGGREPRLRRAKAIGQS
jgi:hypothetical protein